jgi:outer membrane protein OmpA-like peptidoglycan-associated protein
LNKRKAQSVEDYLVGKGVERNNLKIVGSGKDNPKEIKKRSK